MVAGTEAAEAEVVVDAEAVLANAEAAEAVDAVAMTAPEAILQVASPPNCLIEVLEHSGLATLD